MKLSSFMSQREKLWRADAIYHATQLCFLTKHSYRRSARQSPQSWCLDFLGLWSSSFYEMTLREQNARWVLLHSSVRHPFEQLYGYCESVWFVSDSCKSSTRRNQHNSVHSLESSQTIRADTTTLFLPPGWEWGWRQGPGCLTAVPLLEGWLEYAALHTSP